jgi:hypothetical protein
MALPTSTCFPHFERVETTMPIHDPKTAQTGRLTPTATLALAMLVALCAGQVGG